MNIFFLASTPALKYYTNYSRLLPGTFSVKSLIKTGYLLMSFLHLIGHASGKLYTWSTGKIGVL